MSWIESLWDSLASEGHVGGARRVDDSHPCDLYAALDATGRKGLVLVTDEAPPASPVFEAVQVTTSQRHDGRWSIGVWLGVDALRAPFARLCQDLVDATREIDRATAGGFVLSRLGRWRRLLEAGSPALELTQLRGMIGELVVLRRCLAIWPHAEVINAWVGPLEAPQDFVLPSLWIEAKAIYPSAAVVRISSVDQLDVAGRMLLAVVTLAGLAPEDIGVTPAGLVDEIRQQLAESGAHGALLEFDSRLALLGYAHESTDTEPNFRVDSVRFFEVREGFPTIRRRALPQGVAEAVYDIELSGCVPFETSLGQ